MPHVHAHTLYTYSRNWGKKKLEPLQKQDPMFSACPPKKNNRICYKFSSQKLSTVMFEWQTPSSSHSNYDPEKWRSSDDVCIRWHISICSYGSFWRAWINRPIWWFNYEDVLDVFHHGLNQVVSFCPSICPSEDHLTVKRPSSNKQQPVICANYILHSQTD